MSFQKKLKLTDIFDVFSRREKVRGRPVKPLTEKFRNRVMLLCRDGLSGVQEEYNRIQLQDRTLEFWLEAHRRFQYLLGRARLSNRPARDELEDVILFLAECSDGEFLDFIEMIFRTKCYWMVWHEENRLVNDINSLLQLEDLPYHLTEFVTETGTSERHGQKTEYRKLAVFPQVICREDDFLHSSAIEPVISFLAHKGLASAHQEFLEALADYKKKDYGDCLTKCGSAFESTMKLVCARNKWAYKQTDTASNLLATILNNVNLDKFFH